MVSITIVNGKLTISMANFKCCFKFQEGNHDAIRELRGCTCKWGTSLQEVAVWIGRLECNVTDIYQ